MLKKLEHLYYISQSHYSLQFPVFISDWYRIIAFFLKYSEEVADAYQRRNGIALSGHNVPGGGINQHIDSLLLTCGEPFGKLC